MTSDQRVDFNWSEWDLDEAVFACCPACDWSLRTWWTEIESASDECRTHWEENHGE